MTFLKEACTGMSSDEERLFFEETCERIIMNARFYLDHLDDGTFWVYRVSFEDYKKTKGL